MTILKGVDGPLLRWRRSAPALLALLGLSTCAPQAKPSMPAPFSSSAGTIDKAPVSAFGDRPTFLPPEPDGSPYDPWEGLGLQKFADTMIGAHLADFVAHDVVHRHLGGGGEYHRFFPVAHGGPGSGLCQARAFLVMRDRSGPREREDRPVGKDGAWTRDVFAVAGSVAPLPDAVPIGYTARLNDACAARRDMAVWFPAEPRDAAVAARVADAVVTAARRPGPLPFTLTCRPYPAGVQAVPGCSKDVRRTVAAIEPRAVVEVGECFDTTQRPCIVVALAQRPDDTSTAGELQWTLTVTYGNDGSLQIGKVNVEDTQRIVE